MQQMEDEKKHILQEPVKPYGPRFYSSAEEQEMERLKEAIQRTDEEKFYHLMMLMKLEKTMSRATNSNNS